MEFFDDFNFDLSPLAIRYGQSQETIDFMKIAEIEDEGQRNKIVDELVDKLIEDKENTGFFGFDDSICINALLNCRFKIDDREIYYEYFKNLAKNKDKIPEKTTGVLCLYTIAETVIKYFGEFNGDQRRRHDLTSTYYDEDDNFVVPSIKILKNQNASSCIEYAAVSHNLWLLTGVKSYFIVSKDTIFKNKNNFDGHAFNIVEYGGKFKLFDIANDVTCVFKFDPIKNLKNEKPLVIGNSVYANARFLPKRERE